MKSNSIVTKDQFRRGEASHILATLIGLMNMWREKINSTSFIGWIQSQALPTGYYIIQPDNTIDDSAISACWMGADAAAAIQWLTAQNEAYEKQAYDKALRTDATLELLETLARNRRQRIQNIVSGLMSAPKDNDPADSSSVTSSAALLDMLQNAGMGGDLDNDLASILASMGG